MAAAMMPIGPAPVISTSSPTRSNDSAVCVALPSGSRNDATSSLMWSGSLNALTAGMDRYSAKAPGRLDPDALGVAAQVPLARPGSCGSAAGDVPLGR